MSPRASTGAPARRPPVLDALEAAWRRSDRLFDLLTPDALLARPIALRHPFLFYLGHLPAFAFNHIGAVLGRAPLHGHFETLFERGIDPLSDAAAARATREAWPDPAEVRAYRDDVRAFVRQTADAVAALSDAHPMAARLRVHHLVLEHELMHHETLLYMLLQAPLALKRRPAAVADPELATDDGADPEQVSVPAGLARLGVDLAEVDFAWDNELSATDVAVSRFHVERYPVTWARYRRFVDAGGYDDPAWRTSDAWAWRLAQGLTRPMAWQGEGAATRVRWMFGEVPLTECDGWPAQVSHAEASAFARWAGGRLPSEAELALAGQGAAPVAVDFETWAPVPVASQPAGRSVFGIDELLGNGWEWTSTVFAPLPGFDTWHRTYPGYSSDFFDGAHFVVSGGSWATGRALLRPSFRNWYQGHYPYVFSKFRVVYAASGAAGA